MEYFYKEKLFEKFKNQWGERFGKIPSILRYISTYPEITKSLKNFSPIGIKELSASQLEWVSLIAQLDNPIETSFFKDYWVPIQDHYDYFIDLSSDSLPLFKAHFFPMEPFCWYKGYLVEDLTQFLIKIDNPWFSFKNHIIAAVEKTMLEIEPLFKEREELGFAGKLEQRPITKGDIFSEEKNSDLIIQDNCITFNGINSLIIGLMPFDCAITLEKFEALYNRKKNVCDKVKNISGLVYLLRLSGMMSIDFYSFKFNSDKQCWAYFKDNTFKIFHKDKELLKDLIAKYKIYEKSSGTDYKSNSFKWL